MESLEAFTERMSKVEFKEQLVIGRVHQGNTRSIYLFENQHCFLESFGYRTLGKLKTTATPAQMFYVASSEPSDKWVHARLICGKKRATKMAKYYGAYDIEEAPYAQEENTWFSLLFRDFEDLMKVIYDIHTGKFLEMWGKEEKEYVNCF